MILVPVSVLLALSELLVLLELLTSVLTLPESELTSSLVASEEDVASSVESLLLSVLVESAEELSLLSVLVALSTLVVSDASVLSDVATVVELSALWSATASKTPVGVSVPSKRITLSRQQSFFHALIPTPLTKKV